MKDLKALLKDWFGQEELLGRILAKLGSEKTSEVLEQIAEEEGIKPIQNPVEKIKIHIDPIVKYNPSRRKRPTWQPGLPVRTLQVNSPFMSAWTSR
jgi:hypothetical protein